MRGRLSWRPLSLVGRASSNHNNADAERRLRSHLLNYSTAPFSDRGNDDIRKAVAKAFTIGAERTFDQDPRFGLCVLAEIASRALSPAVNDPGTAIDVIGRAVRLLAQWGRFDDSGADAKIDCPHVWVPAIEVGDMFDDVFAPIARDGAGMVEIHLRLQKAFLALVGADRAAFSVAATRHSEAALTRASAELKLEPERLAVREVAAKISGERKHREHRTS